VRELESLSGFTRMADATQYRLIEWIDLSERLPAGWRVLESQPGGRVVLGRAP